MDAVDTRAFFGDFTEFLWMVNSIIGVEPDNPLILIGDLGEVF